MSELDTGPTSQQTPYEDILAVQVKRGMEEIDRQAGGLILSSVSAGLDIGFGPFAMVIFLSLVGPGFGEFFTEFMLANLYSIGFIFVVLGRSELFTEHTATAVFPVLAGRASLSDLGRLWVLVFVGNIIGATIFAAAVVFVTPTGQIHSAAFAELAMAYTTRGSLVLLVGGVFAGWLMGLVTWLVSAAQGTMGRIFFVWLCTAVIAFGQLPHAIAGTVEVMMGVFASPTISLLDYGRFLLLATVGNAVGGTVFIALLRYGHIIRSNAISKYTDTN